MKRKLIPTCLILVLCMGACRQHALPTRKLNYLFVYDKIDQQTIGDFERILTEGNPSLRDELPDSIAELSFTVFISSASDYVPPRISFNLSGDKNYRYNEVDSFLAKLRKNINDERGDRNILHAVENIVSAIADPGAQYKVLIKSDLLENSAGDDVFRTVEDNWRDGKFSFTKISGQGGVCECNCRSIGEATRQLNSDSVSPIHDNLIAISLIKKLSLNPEVIVNHQGAFPSSVANDCSSQSIRNFWKTLFSKLGFHYTETTIGRLDDFIKL